MSSLPSEPTGPPSVAVLATADTKALEVDFIAAELRRNGLRADVVDVGLSPTPAAAGYAATSAEVAGRAGFTLRELRGAQRRDTAMRAMGEGAAELLRCRHAQGRLAGVLGIGGNQGTSIAAAAMRDLPIGVPKLLVSTVASGNIRGFIGDSDIAVLFSVGDLLGGPNAVTSGVLRRAVGALAGMAAAGAAPLPGHRGPRMALTAFGNTDGCVSTAMRLLAEAGADVVPFHASGASGSAMERLIDDGMFDAVLDVTTHELLGELYPADIYAPVRPGRLTAAARAGIPQVVVPGGLEYHCFAGPDTIPAELRDRPVHHHNPNNTNVRSSAAELTRVAAVMADRLNAARGPVRVFIPLRGWSGVGSPGGTLHDPRCNRAFVETLTQRLADSVPVEEVDATINDEAFAGRIVAALRSLMAPATSG